MRADTDVDLTAEYFPHCSYLDGLAVHQRGPTNCIYGFEHQRTITLGIRANPAIDLLLSPSEVLAAGFSVVPTERGGQATLHNSGQLVIYPKLDLNSPQFAHKIGIKKFVQLIEQASSDMLGEYGITTDIACEPGVFVGQKKIAFIGLRIKKSVVHHGISINISNDLDDYKFIKSCGVFNAALTSMRQLGIEAKLEDVFYKWADCFRSRVAEVV